MVVSVLEEYKITFRFHVQKCKRSIPLNVHLLSTTHLLTTPQLLQSFFPNDFSVTVSFLWPRWLYCSVSSLWLFLQLHKVSELIWANLLNHCLSLLHLNKYSENVLMNNSDALQETGSISISVINLCSFFSLETQKAHVSHLSFRVQNIFELWVWR